MNNTYMLDKVICFNLNNVFISFKYITDNADDSLTMLDDGVISLKRY